MSVRLALVHLSAYLSSSSSHLLQASERVWYCCFVYADYSFLAISFALIPTQTILLLHLILGVCLKDVTYFPTFSFPNIMNAPWGYYVALPVNEFTTRGWVIRIEFSFFSGDGSV